MMVSSSPAPSPILLHQQQQQHQQSPRTSFTSDNLNQNQSSLSNNKSNSNNHNNDHATEVLSMHYPSKWVRQQPILYAQQQQINLTLQQQQEQTEDILTSLSQSLNPSLFVDEIGFQKSATTLGDDEVKAHLQKGTIMYVYNRKTKKRKKKMVRLSSGENYITIGSNNRVFLRFVEELRKGHKTRTFQKIENQSTSVEAHCFSLILANGTQTIDLEAPDKPDLDIWFVGLAKCVALAKIQETEQR